MIRKRMIVFVLIGVVFLVSSIFVWTLTSQTADDLYLLHNRSDEISVAVAFTVALRMNHQVAYDLIATDLSQRLEEWTKNHEPPSCTRRVNIIGNSQTIYYTCYTMDKKYYTLHVSDIVIEDMIVVDWGEVIEEYQ